MNYFLYEILILLLFIKSQTKVTPLIIPFETANKKELSPENYFTSEFNNELKIILKVGTHRQSIPCYLNLNSHTVYISGSNADIKPGQPRYEEYKSKKYTILFFYIKNYFSMFNFLVFLNYKKFIL